MHVRMFRNLHKQAFSVQFFIPGKGWRTIAWCNDAVLENVRLTVNKSGRRRTILSRKRCVHAFVEGDILGWSGAVYRVDGRPGEAIPAMAHHSDILGQARYSPWETDSFVYDGQPLLNAAMVLMSNGKNVFILQT